MTNDPSQAETEKAVPPRALAMGTGVVLQTVGLVLFLSTCCVCALAGQWDHVPSRSELLLRGAGEGDVGKSLPDLFREPAGASMMLLSMFMTVGGLAMMVFGLGLQSQKRHSASGALLTMVLALLVLSLSGVGLWAGGAAAPALLWHGALCLVVLALTPLTIAAWRQMRAFPPPPDLHVVGADFDEQAYKRQLRGMGPLTPAQRRQRRAELEAELERLEREEGEGEATERRSDGAMKANDGGT